MNPLDMFKIFSMIPQLVAAVQQIMNSESAHTIESAIQVLIAHNTPGKPNAPALSPSAPPLVRDFQAPTGAS